MVSSKLESSNEKNGTDEHSDKTAVVKVKSDEIVAELLREVCNSDKPFCLEDIAPKQATKEKKKKHKHKKSKKKRRHESRSRSRSRSPSKRSRKSKRRSRSRSSTDTWKSKSPELVDHSSKDAQVLFSPEKVVDMKSTLQQVSDDDDDLPVGADFRTVMREAKMTINIRHPNEKPLDLSLLPSDPGCSVPKQLIKSFPLSKDAKKVDEDDVIPVKKESDVLMKVIASKGNGDFVPRNLKVKSSTMAATVTSTPPASLLTQNSHCLLDNDEPVVPLLNEFGPTAPVLEEAKEEPGGHISDSELERRIEMELAEEIKPRKAETEKWTKLIENSIAAIDRKNGTLSKANPTRKSGSTSSSCDTDNAIRQRANSSKYRSSRKHRSRSRSRGGGRRNRETERKRRSGSRSRKNRSRSRPRRSRSRSRRRRSGSRNHRRSSRSRSRPRKSRPQSRDRNRRRSRSRDRHNRDSSFDGIDKAKLLEIARKKAQGSGKDAKEFNPRSVNDFVSYCEKIQKRQEKEDRREKGEQVSSDGDLSEEETPSFKHPYGVKPADAIKINITNSVPLPTKSTQECILDSSQLRIVFPVSSGSVHKNHKDSSEWTRVEKADAPVTCSTDQKKFVAVTSLGAEKARQTGNTMNLHGPMVQLSAPPPLPRPSSGFVLPPPPPPPKITAFDMLLPLPPPLPPTLLVPRRQDMVMREPEFVDREAPRDVSMVLAQRARAQRALAENPNNYDALRSLKDADEQMTAWDASRNAPGKFTGSTGVNILRPEDLQPQDPRFHAWTRKDMFKTTRPAIGGIGMMLMKKMGWRPGVGLGKEESGSLEPLLLDVKHDRKGLLTEEDLPARVANLKTVVATDLSGKHPVSLVMELCVKRRWHAPQFSCMEFGGPSSKEFIWKVVVNGVEYQSATASRNKKDGKMVACQVVLQSLGLIPKDPSLPIII